MPYFNDLNTYLHQSSLLIQAYPSTRITTKYSLPRKPNPKSKSKSNTQLTSTTTETPTTQSTPAVQATKREPSATLILKTFHPDSGICLKYRTDKAAEVGRLLAGLGKLAKGEIIDLPTTTSTTGATTTDGGDKMDVDGGNTVQVEDRVVTGTPVAQQSQAQQQIPAQGQSGSGTGGAGGGKAKKKKGKK